MTNTNAKKVEGDLTDLRKERVMDVAKARFEKFGYKKTKMIEICEDAEISSKTLYEFFKNKKELFDAVFIREMVKSNEKAISSVEKVQGDDQIERSRIVIKNAVHYLQDNPFMHLVLNDESNLYSAFQKQKYKQLVENTFSNIAIELMIADINSWNTFPCRRTLGGKNITSH